MRKDRIGLLDNDCQSSRAKTDSGNVAGMRSVIDGEMWASAYVYHSQGGSPTRRVETVLMPFVTVLLFSTRSVIFK